MEEKKPYKSPDTYRSFGDTRVMILNELDTALSSIDSEQVDGLVDAILSSEKVFLVGVGRVLLSLKAFAKRLNHLGIPAYCVGENNEPAITERDLLIAASGSGGSLFPQAILSKANSFGTRTCYIGSNLGSTMAQQATGLVRIPVRTKLKLPDEIESEQIMTTLFEQTLYMLGDAVSLMIVDRRNLKPDSLWQYHANLE